MPHASYQTFTYEAQTHSGRPMSGQTEAVSAEAATEELQSLGLRLVSLEQVQVAKAKPVRGEDFLLFNAQLAEFVRADLPVAQGLRLIGQEMRTAGMRETIRQIADDLEAGKSLEEAFGSRRGAFPALYADMLEAGVKTGRLGDVLVGLGRYLELVQRMRGVIWQAVSYPLMVLVGLMAVLTFISLVIFPEFEAMYSDFGSELPLLTTWLFSVGRVIPWIAAGMVALGVLAMVGIGSLKAAGQTQAMLERWVLPLPLLGRALRQNLYARWCDTLAMTVDAGFDLPRGMTMAAAAVRSPGITRDAALIVSTLESGGDTADAGRLQMIPATITAAIDLGVKRNDLKRTLVSLGRMYQQQAEVRVVMLRGVLTPMLMIMLTVIIGMVVMALFLPMVKLITSLA